MIDFGEIQELLKCKDNGDKECKHALAIYADRWEVHRSVEGQINVQVNFIQYYEPEVIDEYGTTEQQLQELLTMEDDDSDFEQN